MNDPKKDFEEAMTHQGKHPDDVDTDMEEGIMSGVPKPEQLDRHPDDVDADKGEAEDEEGDRSCPPHPAPLKSDYPFAK